MKWYKALATTAIVGTLGIYVWNESQPSERQQFESFLENHPYNNIELSDEEIEKLPKKDRPDLAFMQDFLRTLDPALGRPAPERLYPIIKSLNDAQNNASNKTTTITWEERGPTNVGGRTRGIMFDPNDSTGMKVWAGGVAGGLWYNDDISSFNSSWMLVDDFWANMAVCAIAHDPTNTQVFYVGTGEGYGNIDAVRGGGVWKTTDGGQTWAQLASTANSADFRAVFDLDVNPVNGDVYVSTNTGGLQRSQDGGATWTKVLGSGAGVGTNRVYRTDILESGTIWTAVNSSGIYRSYSGDLNTYTKLNAVSNGFSPNPSNRVELAVSPSDTNICYVLALSGGTPRIFKTTNSGGTWSPLTLPNDKDPGIPANDFTRGQSWYDYIVAVNPSDSSHVIVGGVDLFETKDGGITWTQISHWYSGFGEQYVHADQHNIVFRDDTSNVAIFSHDGGVSYTPNAKAGSEPVIVTRIKDYNTTQFYSCAVHPDAGTDYYLAGSQDNGTQQFSQPGVAATVEATGGDGGFCYIDQDNPQWQLTSFTRNSYNFSGDGGVSWGRLNSNDNTGSFINPGDYDDKLNILYTRGSGSSIKRTFINGTTSPNSDVIQPGIAGTPTHFSVSPYTQSSTSMFVGTNSGRVYKVTGANGLSSSASNISAGLPPGSVSCVAIGTSENELVATFSNYGVNSVWYTNNGGASWTSIEGNLPDMPVRWALFNPNDNKDVIIATELGVWQCTDISATNPIWLAENTGLANVRVDMLQIRESDGHVAAATHARGLFTTDVFFSPNPIARIEENREIFCENESYKFNNQSLRATSYLWTVTPATHNFINGTNASSANPEIEFTANGSYTIQLIATNSTGSDTATATTTVGSLSIPFNEDFTGNNFVSRWNTVNVDNDISWELRQLNNGSAVTVQNNSYVGASIVGQVDDLVSPPLDFTGVDNAVLNFNYSYTDRPTISDSLGIFYSLDCGDTWWHIQTYSDYGGKQYRTTVPRNQNFTPANLSQWCGAGTNAPCGYVDLSPYASQKDNVRILFRNYSHNGNNVYIGEVNITESTISVAENNSISMNVFPNPTEGMVTLEWNSPLTESIELSVTSLQGKVVKRIAIDNLGSQKGSIDLSDLPTGIYVISGSIDGQLLSTRVIKQ